MRALIRHPLFGTGLSLRLLLVALVLPAASSKWYVPFMVSTTSVVTADPWSTFLAGGGDMAAFPYGYLMWLVFLPLTLLAKLLMLPPYIGYGMTLLAADIMMLRALNAIVPDRIRTVLLTYWWSPIVIVATYWLGLNDIVPIALLSLALMYTRRTRLLRAGFLCGAAVSAKLSMVLALPFFAIYLVRNKALRRFALSFAKGLALSLAVLCLPFLLSPAGLGMLVHNPEMVKVYQVSLQLGANTLVYLLPMAYLLMLYVSWRVPRINFELFYALFGLAFLLVVLLTSASPGWYVWVIPMLVIYQVSSDRTAFALVGGFALLYAVIYALLTPPPHVVGASADIARLTSSTARLLGDFGVSILYTAMTALGAVLALRIWRQAISANDWFRFSRKPFVIGIAGDSGAGKDTLVDAVSSLFGAHSVARLNGDDYHLWDRQRPMWQVMTHLNPMANDLERFSQDLISLADGRSITSRHYDHGTGKTGLAHTVKSNHIVVASGLHALYLPILRACCDLKIFLDMDERLRRHLKIRRDVGERSHSLDRVLSSLDRREPDSEKFIRTQAKHADLVMSLQPIHPRLLDEAASGEPPRMRLRVRSRLLLNELSLMRVLIGVCGLHVDLTVNQEASEAELVIEGETSGEDVQLAARMLTPRMIEFLDVEPEWHSGVLGLMQLITLSHVNQALNRRLL